jgi:riboflavin kinase/FMN adenylyltransferase
VITTFDLGDLPLPGAPDAVVSIGVFDGVHLGHRAILVENVARARELSALPTVVTFRDHPKRVLLGHAPRTLTTLEHRLELFRRAGVEHTLALEFTSELREVTAEDFVRTILVDRLGAVAFVLGFDSKFGRDRAGGPELLVHMGLPVQVVPEVIVDQRAVSSTAIREAVELGDLAGAARMLGRRVSVFGEVVHGDALGRRIGFPTANLDLHHELHPPNGVYACWAHRIRPDRPAAAEPHPCVVNIGVRPTVSPGESRRVEVHLIDFEGDLYGEHLELEFVALLRPEQRFEGLEGLQSQIGRDVRRAADLLALEKPATRRSV